MNKIDKVVEFAERKMKKYNLDDWSFELGSAKRTAGTCYESRKLIRMSKPLINARTLDDSYNTVLHEIAHALAGCRNGHNHVWKITAQSIGAKPERCFNSAEIDKNKMQYKYTLTCPSCGKQSGYSRQLKRRKSCGVCCSYFNPQFELVVTQNY